MLRQFHRIKTNELKNENENVTWPIMCIFVSIYNRHLSLLISAPMVITATERVNVTPSTPEPSASSAATFRCTDQTVPLVSAAVVSVWLVISQCRSCLGNLSFSVHALLTTWARGYYDRACLGRISRKRLERFQWSAYRKWHMGYGESNCHVIDDVTWPVAWDGRRCARLVEVSPYTDVTVPLYELWYSFNI